MTANLPAGFEFRAGAPFRYIERQKPAQLLIIGSSLLVTPILEQCGLSMSDEYIKAHYDELVSAPFLSGIKSKLKRSVIASNLAVPGLCAIDQNLLVQYILKNSVKPNVIVYGISVRDLVDNLAVTDEKATFMYRLLQFSEIQGSEEPLSISHIIKRERLFFESVIKLLKQQITKYMTISLGHPATLWDAAVQGSSTESLENNSTLNHHSELSRRLVIENDLNGYRARYLPFSQEKYSAQLSSFIQLCSACRLSNVSLIVIMLPVSESNLALLPKGRFSELCSQIAFSCQQNQARFVNLHNSTKIGMQESDYFDSCHMSRDGFKKFLPHFLDECILYEDRF